MTQPANERRAESRRDFLKTSTLVAGGALAGSLAATRHVHAGADDTIKVGLIGCGGRGTGAASQALHTTGPVKLVAVGDAFAPRIDRCMHELEKVGAIRDRIDVPVERRFVGFDAYKQVIDSGVDLVILATPPGFRPIHFAAAVDAGKHVFMEKPVAVDAPGVRAVLEATAKAKQKGLGVGVGLQRHHQAEYIETIKRLQDGAIGDIVTGRAYWNGAGLWNYPKKPEQTEMEYQMTNWYYFNWLCGDHIVEQHIHNLDVINWLKGAYPTRCQAMGGRQVRTGADFGEIYDHFACEFEYADGSRMFSYCRHIPGCWDSVTEHAHGTKGNGRPLGFRDSCEWRGALEVSRPTGQSLPGRARRSVRQHPIRQSAQRGGERSPEHHDRDLRPHGDLLGQNAEVGGRTQLEAVAGPVRIQLERDAAGSAGGGAGSDDGALSDLQLAILARRAARLNSPKSSEGHSFKDYHMCPSLALRASVFALLAGLVCKNFTRAAEFLPTVQDQIVPKDAKLELVWDEGAFTEGPAAAPDGTILFSDIGDRILRFDPRTGKTSVFREPSGKANGLAFDRGGRLYACEGANGGNRRVTVTSTDGAVTVLCDRYRGRRFNSPNDVAIDAAGRAYFSDPRYVGEEPLELDFSGVYLVVPSEKPQLATGEATKPNGLAVSLDGRTLCVSDNDSAADGNHQLLAFAIGIDGLLTNKRVLFDFGPNFRGIDGMTIDAEGNIYATAGKDDAAGVYVFDAAGKPLAMIATPGAPTNCEFGRGGDKNLLYITSAVARPKADQAEVPHGLFRMRLLKGR